jgi:hypothetical protein
MQIVAGNEATRIEIRLAIGLFDVLIFESRSDQAVLGSCLLRKRSDAIGRPANSQRLLGSGHKLVNAAQPFGRMNIRQVTYFGSCISGLQEQHYIELSNHH